MRLTTTLLAGAACTQAVSIQLHSASQLQTQVDAEIFNWIAGAVEDIGEWTVGAIEDIGEWTTGAFEDAWEWTAGAAEDVFEFTVDAVEWTGGALEDAVEWTGGALEDAWEWTEGAVEDAIDWTGGAFEDAWEWTEGAVEDAIDWTAGAIEDAIDWTGGAFEDAWDWTVGAAEDIGEWTVGAVEDIGEFFVDAGEWIGNAAIDVWDWTTDGSNWEAFGLSLWEALGAAWTFDLGGFVKVFADDRHWSGDGRDELENIEIQMEKFKESCIQHIANITSAGIGKDKNYEIDLENHMAETYTNLTKARAKSVAEAVQNYTTKWYANKEKTDDYREYVQAKVDKAAEYCATEEKPLGHKFDVEIRLGGMKLQTQMTKTQKWSNDLKNWADFVWRGALGHIDREECEATDCLHRCYGTAQTKHCGFCKDTIESNIPFRGQRSLDQIRERCSKCQLPPVEDEPVPEPYEETSPWNPPTDSNPIPEYSVWKVDERKRLEDVREKQEQEREENLTPEKRAERKAAYDKRDEFEGRCAQLSDPWKSFMNTEAYKEEMERRSEL